MDPPPTEHHRLDLLTAFRRIIPDCPALPNGDQLKGTDNVEFQTRQGGIEVDRQVLVHISSKTRSVFAAGELGRVSVFQVDYSKAAVVAVVGAAMTQRESLPIDPRRAAPMLVYELMKLSLSWEIPQLQLWTQVAFVERLCHPVAHLAQIPFPEAVRMIRVHAESQPAGSRMTVCGLVGLLRILHSPTLCWTLDELMEWIAGKPALWKSVIQRRAWCATAACL
ncbi:uncharacterized protein LOC129590347 [Paramacrobiotus metropolitanus]|uniref:uncharacterized protein LOC129590347 n=1 Tax=Paramacrobiotus metropolitanus TaxID=2943436 RepID=UPI0024461B61|nr:uncharacterized protein LOC129590347 [Paramacrobiotus metropolitanus]